MVPGAERSQVIDALRMVQLGILLDDRLVCRLHLCPHVEMRRRSVRPRAAIVLSAIIRTAVRHRLLNRCADAMKIVWQMVGVQRSLHRHHAAANIDTDRRRNDGATSRNHASDGRTDAPMHVRHRRHPLVDERQLRDIQKLLARRVLQRHTLGPGLDGHAVLRLQYVVSCVCHRLSLLTANARRHKSGGSARN